MKIRGQLIKDPKERLKSLSKIDSSSNCWEWIGAFKGKNKLQQYGNIVVGSRIDKTRKTISAHRYSYEIFVGKIPDGKWVLHKCDNPKCINPNHLFLGNRQDNVNDRQIKNRNKPINGELNPNCKHTLKQIYEIKRLYSEGKTMRELSKLYGYKGHKTIFDIIHGKRWNLAEPPK